jgi:hypothetical protein
MTTITRGNERSWAISMISDLNISLQDMELLIKRAGGETTISVGHQRMFPMCYCTEIIIKQKFCKDGS